MPRQWVFGCLPRLKTKLRVLNIVNVRQNGATRWRWNGATRWRQNGRCFCRLLDILRGVSRNCHATIADLLISSLDAPPESAFHLSGAVECRTLLAGVGFETPSWFVVASAPPRRPTVAETDPAVRAHFWQFFASRAVEEQFIASTVTPRLTPTEEAALFLVRSHGWARIQCHPHR